MGLGTWLELELGSQLSSEHLEMVRDLERINMRRIATSDMMIMITTAHLVDDLEVVPVLGVDTLCWE